MYLIVNGVVPLPWDERSQLVITDWFGNEVRLATTGAISLAFSAASIAKAVVYLNVIRVHMDEVSNGRQILSSLAMVFEHLPFLAAAAFFRIAVIVILTSYLNNGAFLAIAIFWLSCLAIGYRR